MAHKRCPSCGACGLRITPILTRDVDHQLLHDGHSPARVPPASAGHGIDHDRRVIRGFGSVQRLDQRGERIAQLVPAPVLKARFVEVTELEATHRGAGGFGSTGR